MTTQDDGGKVRINVTIDREVLEYFDFLVKNGQISKGRKVYRTRSAALEFLMDQYAEDRLEAADATAKYLFTRGRS